MADEFTIVGGLHQATAFDDYIEQQTGKYAVPYIALLNSIRHHHPGMTVTVTATATGQANLLGYATAVGAVAQLDTTEDGIISLRSFIAPTSEQDSGSLYDATQFARYKYTWKKLEFILYTVQFSYTNFQYILFPPDSDENDFSNSKATDALLVAVGQAQFPFSREYILVFDLRWYKSRPLYFEVQKTTWNDVILDQEMKDAISHTIEEFFDNEKKYRDFGVPWKRGIIFYGPPGNGKTLSLRALMHSLSTRREHVNLLYVKSITRTWDIGNIFSVARANSPCLLILEDIDTLVSRGFQSYFFNEVDGLANNDGIMMIATTNHLEKLDGGLANRPSRFDRKYSFPVPNYEQRVLYSEFWRKKLQDKEIVDFPKVLSPKIAEITEKFSFAYMKEAFVATLLALARAEWDEARKEDKDIDNLPFWKEMQKQVKILRDEMRTEMETMRSATFSQIDLISTTSHLQQPQVQPEVTLQHKLGSRRSGDPSIVSSMPPPPHRGYSGPLLAEPMPPSMASSPPAIPFANHSPWAKTPASDGRHDLATLGPSPAHYGSEQISTIDEGFLRLFETGHSLN